MRALGKPIEVHWYGAGHLGSFAQLELSIRHQAIVLRFVYRVIHGLGTA